MLKRILMSILTATGTGLAGAENLLKNPSFESGLDGWDSPAWIKDLVEPKPDNTVFFRGQASLKTSGEPGKIGYIRQTIKLPVGTKELTFAGRIKTTDLPRPWSAGIFIECCDAKNKTLKRYIRETSWQKPENDWVLCGACVPVPEGTVHVNFILRMHNANTWKGKPDNSGSAWFDDLQLYAGKVPEVLSVNTPAEKKTSAIQSVEPVRPGGVFQPGEKVVMKCVLEKSGLDAGYTITDFFGKKVAEGKVGGEGEIAFDAPKKNGYYVVKVALAGNRYGEKTGSFIVEEEIASADPFF